MTTSGLWGTGLLRHGRQGRPGARGTGAAWRGGGRQVWLESRPLSWPGPVALVPSLGQRGESGTGRGGGCHPRLGSERRAGRGPCSTDERPRKRHPEGTREKERPRDRRGRDQADAATTPGCPQLQEAGGPLPRESAALRHLGSDSASGTGSSHPPPVACFFTEAVLSLFSPCSPGCPVPLYLRELAQTHAP